jgi:3-oxoacyl-[acyl-carrier-protein] synthase-3
VPSKRVSNDYFFEINGLTADWILKRTGIETRSKAGADETGVTMGLAATAKAIEKLSYSVQDVDLIVSAGYTPEDTVGTLAHIVQREYNIRNARTMMVSTACSSFLNALEIVQGYFALGKATKALIICSEINSAYNNECDPKCGHLWGDAAIAMFVSKERITGNEPEILNITTRGLGHVGKGPAGVILSLRNGGLQMMYGKDVFSHAVQHMIEALKTVAGEINITVQDVDYVIAHQANMRIVSSMLHVMNIPEHKSLNNIKKYGNTGSASAFLVFMEHWHLYEKNMLIGITVFGGGYSSGAILIRF